MATASDQHDEQNFSRWFSWRVPVRRCASIQLGIAGDGVPENFGVMPGNFRTLRSTDGNVENSFLETCSGKPQRMDACECERDNGSNMLQAKHALSTGKSIPGPDAVPAARQRRLIARKLPDKELVTELFLQLNVDAFSQIEELKVNLDFLASDKTLEGGASSGLDVEPCSTAATSCWCRDSTSGRIL